MRNKKIHKANTYNVIYKKVRGGYTTWVEEVPGVISEGKTRQQAEKNIKDALELMLETNRILALKEAVGDVERSTISSPITKIA